MEMKTVGRILKVDIIATRKKIRRNPAIGLVIGAGKFSKIIFEC